MLGDRRRPMAEIEVYRYRHSWVILLLAIATFVAAGLLHHQRTAVLFFVAMSGLSLWCFFKTYTFELTLSQFGGSVKSLGVTTTFEMSDIGWIRFEDLTGMATVKVSDRHDRPMFTISAWLSEFYRACEHLRVATAKHGVTPLQRTSFGQWKRL
jgi:hypothetical protein